MNSDIIQPTVNRHFETIISTLPLILKSVRLTAETGPFLFEPGNEAGINVTLVIFFTTNMNKQVSITAHQDR